MVVFISMLLHAHTYEMNAFSSSLYTCIVWNCVRCALWAGSNYTEIINTGKKTFLYIGKLHI